MIEILFKSFKCTQLDENKVNCDVHRVNNILSMPLLESQQPTILTVKFN